MKQETWDASPRIPVLQVGEYVNKEDIDTRVKEAMMHRRIMNTRHNELLAAKHQAYRDLIYQQIKERDASLNQPSQLKETTDVST